ncbi:AraC family transcriptional regulator [Bradyrhizobium murdochi]|uniref:AraC family transcriptional regulator n=1 Tax=Bradyrhizobium murdochi TaxID=1038859 RepID=UPI0004848ECF|nr:AraC family transcriptional regulator [Bradyrhizobium murdochi]
MDALSEALTSVRMTGAIFYRAECTAPWGFRVPHLQNVAHLLAPGTERLISYHLVTQGKAVVCFADEENIAVTAGDILIIPHGDAHTVSNGPPSTFVDSGASLGSFLAGDLTTMQLGGGGELTTFVCGYFGCERHAERLFLAGLPLMIKINLRGDPAGEWLESSVRHLVCQAGCARPGHSVLLSKMAEALFIEAIRRYMEALPAEQTGWLAGARDPVVGGALALLHRKPYHRWTVEELAAETAVSRSVLAERFSRFLGEPPLTYLARWRLQLAARMLQTTTESVVEVACEVGYDSEAAFNRAFKREFGLPPGQFRRSRSRPQLVGGAGPTHSPSRAV